MALVLEATVVVAASDTWAGAVGLVAAAIGAVATMVASVVYVRRSREARASEGEERYEEQRLEQAADRSPAELKDAADGLWRQREVLTRAIADSQPGETSIALAEQMANLDSQLAQLMDAIRHARASKARSADSSANAPPAEPYGQA
ncbi:MAG: hypothetical protein LC808_28250 [Actinobacteria bacterium]|nr:hypothetical protein [Actinomycetota bacterium]